MKKLLYIVFFLFTIYPSIAQEDQPGADRLREKMLEYIQTNLNMTKSEAENVRPHFMDYLNQVKQASHEHKDDRLLLQKKIADIRIKFREKVKPIIGEKRSNDVFIYEHEFVQKIKAARSERGQERPGGRANKRNNPKL
jgi:hypothetical protein